MTALLSDVNGLIRYVFFALPGYDDEFQPAMLSCFRGVRAALGPDVRCTVLHHPQHADVVQRTLGDLGQLDLLEWQQGFVLRLRDAGAHVEGGTLRIGGGKVANPDFTTWVQDGFLVANDDSGQARILASPRVKRTHGGWDDEVARLLAGHLGWPIDELPCGVEAGNVLVDDNGVVIGADVQTNGAADLESLTNVIAMANDLRVCVPERSQPIFHLDLYLTLAGVDARTGKPLAMVGSVALGREIAGEEHRDTDVAMYAGLAEVADYFVRAGYRVERLPLLPFLNEPMTKPGVITYNNCLVEVFSQRRRVLLPSYGLKEGNALEALDRAAAGIWEKAGFEVTFARGDFARIAELYGSLRCMTKVLQRSDTM